MNNLKNIGNWSAVIQNNGKAPQLIVNGTFPTNGEKLIFELVKPLQGINERILILVLSNGHVVDEKGKETGSLIKEYPEIMSSYNQYDMVSIYVYDEKGNKEIAQIIPEFPSNNFAPTENESFVSKLEILKGIEILHNTLKIRVSSNGLTSKESFCINIIKGFTEQPPFLLEIVRVKPDNGKAFLPDGIILEYAPEELKQKFFSTYRLLNLIG